MTPRERVLVAEVGDLLVKVTEVAWAQDEYATSIVLDRVTEIYDELAEITLNDRN